MLSDLLEMTPEEVRKIDKAKAVVIINTGATEQHGGHLPVGTDSFLGEGWMQNLNLSHFYIGPRVEISKSLEHWGYGGTLSVNTKMWMRIVDVILKQIWGWGFKKILFLNTHGGNRDELESFVGEYEGNHNVKALYWYYVPEEMNSWEKTHGIHAGELETSVMLAIDESAVKMEFAERGGLEREGKWVKYAESKIVKCWHMRDVSGSGVLGDGAKGTQEQGKKWLREGAIKLAERINRIYQ